MYIYGIPYPTDLKIYHSLRDYMVFNVYNHEEYINAIINLISNKIDCLDIGFDTMRYEININIKKTTMRRAKGYKASSMYYYGIMNSVFKDFFELYPNIAANVRAFAGIDLSNFDASKYDNLCQINCIGDKIVTIKL